MSCGCSGSPLWGGKCCAGPGQPAAPPPPPPTSLPGNVDLSALGIFNAGFYGLAVANPSPMNTSALAGAGQAVCANGGGTIWIPNGIYQIDATPSPPIPMGSIQLCDGTTVQAAGATTTLVANSSGNIFWTPGAPLNKGINFRDLRFAAQSGYIVRAGQYEDGAQNIRYQNCYFNTLGPWFDDGSLSSGCDWCTLDYHPPMASPSIYDNQWFFYFSGAVNYMRGCTIRQTPIKSQSEPQSDGPVGCVGIYLSTNHEIHLTDISLQGMDFGMQIDGGCTEVYCTVLSFQCRTTALSYNMHSSVGQGESFVHKYTSCRFSQDQGSDVVAPIVRVNLYGGASNTQLDDIQFEAASIYQGNGNGLQLDAGHSIDFQGRIGSCGFNTGDAIPTGTYYGNVALTSQQGPDYVNIHDSDLSGVHEMSALHLNNDQPHTSPWAIVFDLGPNNGTTFLCSDTNLSGCTNGPVVVATGGNPPAFASFTRCVGYTDQGYVLADLNNNFPVAAGTSASTLSGSWGAGYFGPTEINMLAGGGNVVYNLNGISYQLLANDTLQLYIPSPYTAFYIVGSVLPNVFRWRSVWQ